jgi:hypothetical protein
MSGNEKENLPGEESLTQLSDITLNQKLFKTTHKPNPSINESKANQPDCCLYDILSSMDFD